MVFQKPNPFPKTIFENVAYGLRVNGISDAKFIEERVEASIKQVALWDEAKDKLKKSAFELSGGQQQRLCIARALAIQPSIILNVFNAWSLLKIDVANKESSVSNDLSMSDGVSDNAGAGYSEKESEEYKVTPDQLKSLQRGEAIITCGGDEVFHISIPRLEASEQLKRDIGPVKLNRHRVKWVDSIDLFRQADRFISTGSKKR